MPIIDLVPNRIDAPRVAPPIGHAITPGADDIERGSDAATERPSWSATFGAAFRQDNTVGAYFASEAREALTYREDGFNPWDTIKGTEYEQHWRSFVNVHNPQHAEAIKRKLDREKEDRKLLDSLPWYQSLPAQMIAGVVDLPTLLPGGAFVRGVQGGFSISRSALNVALAAGASATAQEIALQGLTETRPLSESAVNVGASVFLGGLLGAGAARLLTNAEWSAGVRALDRELAREAVPTGGIPASAGAAANLPADIDANTIAGRAAGAVARATSQLNPLLRAMTSPSAAYREIAGKLMENPVYLKKNFENVASDPAVETLMKEWNAGLVRGLTATHEAFPDYRKAGGPLTFEEFRDAVGRAMRRNDQDADPHITRVAQTWRKEVFDPLKEAAIKAGLLPEDVTVETAASYLSRWWNRNKLIAREGEFKTIVQQWVTSNQPRWAAGFDAETERKLAPLRREIDDLEMGKLRRGADRELRDQGGEVEAGEFSEADIRQALRIVQGGAPKPKGVQTLTQFVHAEGGLVDFAGELASMGITNRTRPGFVKSIRKRAQTDGGGWSFDDMARHAWESGFFPEHVSRPSPNDFLEALRDDFFKVRRVVREADRGAFRLQELIDRLEDDLTRIGVDSGSGRAPRFSTTEEVKGIVDRIYKALDAEADQRIAALKAQLSERQATRTQERDARFIGDPKELGREIGDEVFNTLTGKTVEGGVRPEFITIKARGPMKERTFNIPDELIEEFLESDIEAVARRYVRVMGADIELANKFGKPDMLEQIRSVREDYQQLRQGVTDEKELTNLGAREKADIKDLENIRDLLRGTYAESRADTNYGRMSRMFNNFNYIRSMGEVVLASITDAVRPAMVHGLSSYMGTVGQLATNMTGIRMSVREAQLAGNVAERVLGSRLATLSEIADPYASRGPVDAFLEKMTNVASKWNGIRLWTDMGKSLASVMTQNRILGNVENFAKLTGRRGDRERAYLAYLGIDESMAGRIAQQFAEHGETIDGVRVANTEAWADPVAVRTYRAAMNKDVDSIIVTKGVGDVPTFANTPTGRMLLQFKTFALSSHQRVLLRGLQEDQARFVGGIVAMTTMGMMITYLKAVSGNRPEIQERALNNPGWWIGEGFDRSGIMSVPMEAANAFEKIVGLNPIKGPVRAFDATRAISQKNQNRNEFGSFLGPTAGLAQDFITAAGIPKRVVGGEEVTQGQITAVKNLMPFNSYMGIRQMLNHVVAPPAR